MMSVEEAGSALRKYGTTLKCVGP